MPVVSLTLNVGFNYEELVSAFGCYCKVLLICVCWLSCFLVDLMLPSGLIA